MSSHDRTPGAPAHPDPAAPATSAESARRAAAAPSAGGTARRALLVGVLAFAVAAIGAVVAVAAFVGGSEPSCRQTAWNASADPADLPAGWSIGASQVAVDGLATSVAGPAPEDATAEQATVYVMVSCYGKDAAAGVDRSRAAAEAVGETVEDRPDLGDEGFAIVDAESATTAVYFRQGDLVAYVAPSGTVDPADLDAITAAVAAGVDRAVAGRTLAPGAASPVAAASAPASNGAGETPQASTSSEAEPSPSASQVAPELLAMLPTEVAGIAVTGDSATGTELLGTDAVSRAMTATLAGLGATPADLQVAQAYDETGALDLYLLAFRAPGLSGTDLAPAVVDTWLQGKAAGVATSTVKLAGREVTKVTYGDAGSTSYVYRSGEAVIVIETSDETLADQVVALLP